MFAHADLPQLRSPFSATLAMAVALALLFAFGLVVHGIVQQAALRQIETRAQAEAVWRCAWSKGAGARDDCQNDFRVRRVASLAMRP